MTITDVTRTLKPNALRRLTASASRPETATIAVEQWARSPRYLTLSPLEAGNDFHEALARFLGKKKLHGGDRMFYPFMAEIRSYLHGIGFEEFETEVDVRNKSVRGRIDILAGGPFGSAVVEVKTVQSLPDFPEVRHVVQARLGSGLARVPTAQKGLLVIYVDFCGKKIRCFRWSDQRRACFRPWGLSLAA